MCARFGSIYTNFSALFSIVFNFFNINRPVYVLNVILASNLGVSSDVNNSVVGHQREGFNFFHVNCLKVELI